jgi:hypothetical protein
MTMTTVFELKPTAFIGIRTSQVHSSAGSPREIEDVSDAKFLHCGYTLVDL